MHTALLARRPLVATVVIAALAACSSLTGGDRGLVLDVRQDQVAAGGGVDVSVHNDGTERAEFGACDFELERRVGNVWVPMPRPRDLVCIDIGFSVSPGESREYPLFIPRDAEGGTYRVRLRAWGDSFRSDAFVVEPPIVAGQGP